MKFRANWYDHITVVHVDSEPIEADNVNEATTKAFARYNGNPPAPMLWLEEVKE